MKYTDASGGQFTSWQPNCSLTQDLQDKYGVKDSNEFRRFLQQNAEKIIKDMAESASKCVDDIECKSCPVCKKALDWAPKASNDDL